MSQNASEKTAIMCSQNNMADASFSAWPRRLVTAPEDIKITKIDQHWRLNKFFFSRLCWLATQPYQIIYAYLKLETNELGWFVPGKILTWNLEPALENTTQLVDLALEKRTDTPSSYQGSFWGFIENSVLKKFKSWFWYINIVLKFFWEKKKKTNSHNPTTSSLIVLFLKIISSLRFWKKPGSIVLWFCWNQWFFISSNNNTTLVDALPDAIPLKAGSGKPTVHFRI